MKHNLAPAVVALAAAAVLAGPAGPAFAAGDEPVVASVNGDAVVRTHPLLPAKPLGAGAAVPLGSQIECKGGCALRLSDGSTIALAPGTRLTPAVPTFVPLETDKPAVRAQRFDFHEGDAVVTLPPATKGPRAVVAGTGGDSIVLVRAGRVRLVSRPAGTVAMALDGSARARGAGVSIAIETGQATTLAPNKRPAEPRPAAPAAEWQTGPGASPDVPDPIALTGAAAAPVGLRWKPAAGAASWRVELARDEAFADSVADRTLPGSAAWFASDPLPPGTYFARVRALDGDGIDGAPAAARRVRVVRMELPAVAIVDRARRAIVAPAGATLRALDPDGLDIAVGRGGFVRASGAVAEILVDEEASRPLRVRLRDDPSSEVAWTIERRALRADIRFDPHLPRWPQDVVEVTVRVEDPSGRSDPTAVVPKMRVLVGTTEVRVAWTQAKGGVWRTRVEPRAVVLPTVVRVVVTDETDAPLGRAFVEVDGPRPVAKR